MDLTGKSSPRFLNKTVCGHGKRDSVFVSEYYFVPKKSIFPVFISDLEIFIFVSQLSGF